MKREQCRRMLKRFIAAQGREVTMHELIQAARGTTCPGKRISDLRKEGCDIPPPRLVRNSRRTTTSYYKLKNWQEMEAQR